MANTVIQDAIEKVQKLIRDFSSEKDPKQAAHVIFDYFIELMQGYQSWVNDLRKVILEQDEEIKRLRRTIEVQVTKIKELSAVH